MTRPLTNDLVAAAIAQQTDYGYAFRFTSAQIPGQAWRYTSLPKPVTIDGDSYTAAVIELTDNKEGGDGSAKPTEFSIELEPVEPFISFVGNRLPFIFTAEVWELFISPAGVVQCDLTNCGTVKQIERDAAKIKLTCQAFAYELQKKIPAGGYFTRLDQRMPYSDDFGVDPDDFSAPGTVVSVSQNVLLCDVASGQATDYYAGGKIVYQVTIAGVVCTIAVPIMSSIPSADEEHPEQGELLLRYPPPYLQANAAFTVYAGYDGTVTQSKTKFDNFDTGLGYFGFPHLPPTANPATNSQDNKYKEPQEVF